MTQRALMMIRHWCDARLEAIERCSGEQSHRLLLYFQNIAAGEDACHRQAQICAIQFEESISGKGGLNFSLLGDASLVTRHSWSLGEP